MTLKNQITWMGRTYNSAKELVKEKSLVPYETFRSRRKAGWDITESLITPPHSNSLTKDLEVMYLYLTGKYTLFELKFLTGLTENQIHELLYRKDKND